MPLSDVLGESPYDPTTYCYESDRLKDRTGDLISFKDGCLFGGVNCVEGLKYSDLEAICRGEINAGMIEMGSSSILSVGEYDEERERWRISRSVMIFEGNSALSLTKNMVLERAP